MWHHAEPGLRMVLCGPSICCMVSEAMKLTSAIFLFLLLLITPVLEQTQNVDPVEVAPLAWDLREEVRHILVTVKNRSSREETRQMPITIYRPQGNGPFPLVIMNHGRVMNHAQRERMRFDLLARYLVAKGFTVFVPTRVGYGETDDDFDPEPHRCGSVQDLAALLRVTSDQVLATLQFAKTQPFVDASRWLVMGASVGGFASIATVARKPPGLIGGINFSGGAGGDPVNWPGKSCIATQIEFLWRQQSETIHATAPMLWLYWKNDLYWGAEQQKQWHQVWIQSGGQAEFYSLPAVGKDGDVGINIDMDHWVPIAERFLAQLGFNQSGIPARPHPTHFASIDQISQVPIWANAQERGYRKFLEAKTPRAFAIGSQGAWGWADGDWAIGRAIHNCQEYGYGCKLYAVDNDVVWAPKTGQK